MVPGMGRRFGKNRPVDSFRRAVYAGYAGKRGAQGIHPDHVSELYYSG